MTTIDLNADMGESFGAWNMGDDAALLDIVTSANIACGFHAGDPSVMMKTVTLAKSKGVGIGAHPGFDDLRGFGRRRITGIPLADLHAMIAYQIGAMQGIARTVGATVAHVKIHGALSNMMSEEPALAQAGAQAVFDTAPELIWMGMATTPLETEGRKLGLKVAPEIYADRAYAEDGTLARRGTEGAMIHDPDIAADNVLRMIDEQAVITREGKRIPTKPASICVHGDNPGAVRMAEQLRERIEKAGVKIAPLSTNSL